MQEVLPIEKQIAFGFALSQVAPVVARLGVEAERAGMLVSPTSGVVTSMGIAIRIVENRWEADATELLARLKLYAENLGYTWEDIEEKSKGLFATYKQQPPEVQKKIDEMLDRANLGILRLSAKAEEYVKRGVFVAKGNPRPYTLPFNNQN